MIDWNKKAQALLRLQHTLVGMLLLGALLSGCQDSKQLRPVAPQLAPILAAASGAALPPTPVITPYIVQGYAELSAILPGDQARESEMVVDGIVTAIGPDRWTTPTGRRPSDPSAHLEALFRPVTIQVQTLLKGDSPSGEILIMAMGGQLGSDQLTLSPAETSVFSVGERVVLFLSPQTRVRLPDGPPLYQINGRYTITLLPDSPIEEALARNSVHRMTYGALISAIRTAPR
ncbi:MAG TPA: hypothetical protein VGE07_16995 [Herpetosiphonaceae bacterium]